MKKTAAVLIFLSAFVSAASAQTARATRPRIVQNPAPATPTDNNTNRPPVLKGGNNSPTAAASSGGAAVEDDEVIRVETNLVTIPVTVIDHQGRFVTGLQKKDFKIFENGVEQQIDSFATVQQPFTVVLLLDVSPSTKYQIDEIHDAAISFVNQLRADDKVIVISFDERVHVLSRPTSDRNALRRAIEQAQFGDGTSLYDAVDNVIKQQLRQIEGRKAVVLFTDGVNTTSRYATYESTVAETQETDVLFYPIRYDTFDYSNGVPIGGGNYPQRRKRNGGILGDILGDIMNGGNGSNGGGSGSAGGSREDYETGRRYLEELARNSGGRMFEANQNTNLDAAFSGIAEELRRQYSLGYYPETVGRTGERKQVKVRVLQPNLAVRAKGSYTVGEMDKKFAGR